MHKPVLYHGSLVPWDHRPLEKVVQQAVRQLLKVVGFRTSVTSQYRTSGQTLGLSDLLVSHPLLIGLGGFEVKRCGETLTEKQKRFAEECIGAHAPYCWGTDDDALWWLVSLRFGEWRSGGFVLFSHAEHARLGLRDPLRYIYPVLDGPEPWPEERRTRILQLDLLASA